jgi:hypothetical protein
VREGTSSRYPGLRKTCPYIIIRIYVIHQRKHFVLMLLRPTVLFNVASLVSLHDCVGNESSRDLLATEPPAIETIDGTLSTVDAVELNIDLSL